MQTFGPASKALYGRADALYIDGESLTHANGVRINTLALSARLQPLFVCPESAYAFKQPQTERADAAVRV
jgi:hypothetical protein